MQRSQNLSYSLVKRSTIYGAGIATRGFHAALYDYTPQVLVIWLLPKGTGCRVRSPFLLPLSSNCDVIQPFLENPAEWYTEDREARLKYSRNTAAQLIYFVESGPEMVSPSLLQKLLYELFMSPDPDFAWMRSIGVDLDPAQQKEVKRMNPVLEVFYEDGKKEGMTEGYKDGVTKGKRMQLRTTVQGMLREHLDVNLICRILDLTPEQVEAIHQQEKVQA